MIDKVIKALQDAGESLREQTAHIGTGAKEKAYQLIEDWLQVFPQLEAHGLVVKSFALGLALSPSLEVDMVGKHADFTPEKLAALLATKQTEQGVRTVLSAIRTTYRMHQRIGAPLQEPLIVKVRIKLSPEVKVFLGEPVIQ
ncbi:MAG: hypothetical protein D6772_13290 [Bacteroidetes bacterium]|nr:MAG: hypothetical protein D6772_13290 [Bacteroidota bacterium]